MVNARLCETARRSYFCTRPRLFQFLKCETELFELSKCEPETFEDLKNSSPRFSEPIFPLLASSCTKKASNLVRMTMRLQALTPGPRSNFRSLCLASSCYLFVDCI